MISSSAILEINTKNILYNYRYLKSITKNTHIGATIKANAYGLGDIEIFKILYNAGCRHFFVATLEEALKIRKKHSNGKIYMLNGLNSIKNIKTITEKKIIPVINSIESLKILNNLKKKINIAVHIDTGINRLGLSINELKSIKFNKNFKISLVLSHLASSDETKNNYNKIQNNRFKKSIKNFKNINFLSIANSMGIFLGKSYHYNLARSGIFLYGGYYNSKKLRKIIKPVVKLKAEIIQIKQIQKNNFIGYNQTYKTKNNKTIAILGIGYADGISRLLSNVGYVYYKEKRFKILGRVSMDTITVDITGNDKIIKTGMYLEIINYQNDIEKIAYITKTISNEILTSISNRVKRIYI